MSITEAAVVLFKHLRWSFFAEKLNDLKTPSVIRKLHVNVCSVLHPSLIYLQIWYLIRTNRLLYLQSYINELGIYKCYIILPSSIYGLVNNNMETPKFKTFQPCKIKTDLNPPDILDISGLCVTDIKRAKSIDFGMHSPPPSHRLPGEMVKEAEGIKKEPKFRMGWMNI